MTFLPIKPAAGVRCSGCGKYIEAADAPEIQQPKQLAKKLRWKHGIAKGSWVCPECQKFTPVQPERGGRR
jgi:hypothetical protein